MAYVCDNCRKSFSGEPGRTITGRRLDPVCFDKLTGLTAGVTAGEGVGGSIATAGIFARLRARRRNRV